MNIFRFLEAKPRLNFEKQEAYADYLEYLKDELRVFNYMKD